MTIPKVKNIYLYKGKKYIVRYCAIIDPVLIAQSYDSNDEYSTFENFNYWKFAINAKYIGKEKLSSAY